MELVFSVVLAVFLVFMLVIALGMPSASIEGDVLKAGGFPTLVIIITLFVIAFLLFECIKKMRKEGNASFGQYGISKNVLGNIGIFAGYLLIMNVAGFTMSTLIFLGANARAMGYRNYKMLALFAVVLTALLVVIFGRLFYIPLPRGIGVLREFSYSLY